jgi:hypothetical protein
VASNALLCEPSAERMQRWAKGGLVESKIARSPDATRRTWIVCPGVKPMGLDGRSASCMIS